MIWSKMMKILILSFGIFGSFHLKAQTKLSMFDALALAEKNNLSLKIDEQNLTSVKRETQQSRALFLPQINLSHTAIGTTNPLMAFGSKLNQEILTQEDFNPALLNDPQYIRDYSTKISVQQPIFNFDGIYQRKAAQQNIEYHTQQNTFKKGHVLLEVKKAYMQLQVALKQVEVLKKAKQTADANLRFAENNLKQGYLQKSDFLDVEVRVQDVDNQLQMSKSFVANATNYLRFLLQLPKNQTLTLTDALQPKVNKNPTQILLPETRSDLLAMESALKAQSHLLNASKFNYLPRLNAFGHLELHDDKIFGTQAKGYLIGAQISWDLFQGGKQWSNVQKNKVEVAKMELTISEYKAQSKMELEQTKRALNDAKNTLELTEKSVKQSQEALKIRTNRFKQGLEKTTDLLMAETQYAKKQLEYLQAVFNYNFTYEYLAFLTKAK